MKREYFQTRTHTLPLKARRVWSFEIRPFLAPLAERQQSFSNADLSVVRRRLSVRPSGIIVSPVRSTYGGYYGLVVVTPRPRPQTLHRSHDNLKNPYRIASIFYM